MLCSAFSTAYTDQSKNQEAKDQGNGKKVNESNIKHLLWVRGRIVSHQVIDNGSGGFRMAVFNQFAVGNNHAVALIDGQVLHQQGEMLGRLPPDGLQGIQQPGLVRTDLQKYRFPKTTEL